jgi:hypothetical protein
LLNLRVLDIVAVSLRLLEGSTYMTLPHVPFVVHQTLAALSVVSTLARHVWHTARRCEDSASATTRPRRHTAPDGGVQRRRFDQLGAPHSYASLNSLPTLKKKKKKKFQIRTASLVLDSARGKILSCQQRRQH